jgi:CPA2 family monovalent cation:H+ antiporter-2
LVVGPFTPGVVADPDEVLALADIGVALLMFSIGLRFRLTELREVGRLVLIGAPLQVGVTMALGVGAMLALGAGLVEGLFMGAVAGICSSVVLVKVVGEEALNTTPDGRIALSWSIVQDLLTVVLVVLLSAVAAPSDALLLDAAIATLLALGFVGGVLVIGSRVLPAVLGRVAMLGSRELFVVAVAVVAIGTAALAHEVGVSVALGAFIAGLALAESELAASVLGEVIPLRELFATVFFVSVGILLSPAAVLAGWPVALSLLLIIVLGKALPVVTILRLARQPFGTSLRAAGLLAQSGEFSFVLATVGLQLGALNRDRFSLAMGAVVLSIVAAGPVARVTAAIGERLDRRFPAAGGPAAASEVAADLRRHVVLVGYGAVGRTVSRMLEARSIPWVAVDAHYSTVRKGLDAGMPLVYGDAATPAVLEATRIEAASTMVIALDDPLATQQAAAYAIGRNDRLYVVARAHSVQEEAALRRIGVAQVITAERQLGNELVRHTLIRYGVSDREVDTILRRRG